MAKHPKNHNRAEKRRPGRPRNSPLDPIEQARARRQRHRESKRNAGMVPAEIWLPKAWRDAVIARRNPSGRGAGSFPVAYGALGEKLRETALRVQPSTSNLHMLTQRWPVEQTESRERGLSGVAQRVELGFALQGRRKQEVFPSILVSAFVLRVAREQMGAFVERYASELSLVRIHSRLFVREGIKCVPSREE
jgi:hypothetical protein